MAGENASRAAQFSFFAWIRSAEDVDMEIENTLDRIKTFFQKHAETRFCKLFWIFPLFLSLVANEGELVTAGRLASSPESIFIVLRAVLRDVLMIWG